jgi:hypothetical protein
MTDFNLRLAHECWEWEHDGITYGTDPQGNGIWRKLPKPEPDTIPLEQLAKLTKQPHKPIQYTREWEQIVARASFHLPADRAGALNKLKMYYGA